MTSQKEYSNQDCVDNNVNSLECTEDHEDMFASGLEIVLNGQEGEPSQADYTYLLHSQSP